MDASPDEVWSVLVDHSTWPSWHADHGEHEAITEASEGMGAQFHTKDWILHTETEVTLWDPGEAIGLTILRATAWRWLLRSHYSEIRIEPVEDSPGQVRVRYGVAFTGTLIFWLLCAYTVGYSVASIYWGASSSLKNLENEIVARR